MRQTLFVGLAFAVIIAFLSPLASAHPDGLERVAEDQGFLEQARDAPYEVLPDYTVPGVPNERVSTILAGLVGVVLVTAGTLAAARLLSRGRPSGAAALRGDLRRRD